MIVRWAMKNGSYQPSGGSVLKLAAREFARAMRDEYYTDAQGRRVRKKHAYRVSKMTPLGERQYTLWVDILDAGPAEMRLAFRQRRGAILCDCKQLKTDVDSYNDNNFHGAQLEMDFNFEEDLEEIALSTEYPTNSQAE
jgi:hypothetical protein